MAVKMWGAARILVYNTCGSFFPSAAPGKNALPGFNFVYSISHLVAVLREVGEEKPFRICYCPVQDLDKSPEEKFFTVCELVRDRRNIVFAIDEVWNFQNPSWSPKPLRDLMLQWRHYQVTLLWTAQQPQLTDTKLRSVTTEAYVGKLCLEHDLRAARDCQLRREAIDQLPLLAPHVFVHRMENLEWRLERA